MGTLVGVYEATDDASEPFIHNHISTELPKEGEFIPVAKTKEQACSFKNKIWRIGIGTLTATHHIINIKWLNED